MTKKSSKEVIEKIKPHTLNKIKLIEKYLVLMEKPVKNHQKA